MFIDTHCHLTIMVDKKSDEKLTPEHYEIIDNVMLDARSAQVQNIINISTTFLDSINSVDIAKRYDDVYATVGIHPCDCTQDWRSDLKKIEALVKNKEENKIVGIGEIGLDFYHKPFNKPRQIDSFTAQIECALKYDLPVVVHIRESVDEVLKVLEQYKNELRGVAHCFFQSKAIAEQLISWGFYLGIGGPLTYPKNDWLRDIIKDIPLQNLLLETDAPFLPPQQFRGKQNHPKYIPLIAQQIAEIKEVDVKVVGETTTASAKKLFGI